MCYASLTQLNVAMIKETSIRQCLRVQHSQTWGCFSCLFLDTTAEICIGSKCLLSLDQSSLFQRLLGLSTDSKLLVHSAHYSSCLLIFRLNVLPQVHAHFVFSSLFCLVFVIPGFVSRFSFILSSLFLLSVLVLVLVLLVVRFFLLLLLTLGLVLVSFAALVYSWSSPLFCVCVCFCFCVCVYLCFCFFEEGRGRGQGHLYVQIVKCICILAF